MRTRCGDACTQYRMYIICTFIAHARKDQFSSSAHPPSLGVVITGSSREASASAERAVP